MLIHLHLPLPPPRPIRFSRVITRSFHPTRARPFVEPVLSATHALLDTLHTTSGLPWITCLSLSALVLRASTTPLYIYTRRLRQRQLDLQPLLHAWQHQITQQAIVQASSVRPRPSLTRVNGVMRHKRQELYRRWRCQQWKRFLPLAQLPVFLIAIETIRRMCGTHEGLLGLLLKHAAPSSSLPVDAPRDEVLASAAAAAPDVVTLEPSFATEGGLWVPDLLAPDPLLLLPFMLSGTLLANLYVGAANRTARQRKSAPWQKKLDYGLKAMALLIGPATLQVPSAMLVYWVSSSAFALGQNLLLDRWMALRSSLPPPSKRPQDWTRDSTGSTPTGG
ncbi:MAG: hypothetical protein M1826_000741 [Phylliscum demangeonii]|nr:MAG: hypothetical protein M1826_000741 [Phylliscum demangeonii]